MRLATQDSRGIAAIAVILLAMVGFVALTISGDIDQAEQIATIFGLPALTFLFGLASDPFATSVVDDDEVMDDSQ